MPHAADTRQHYGLTFAVLALGGAAYALLQSLVAPALPDIQRELHTSATAATWVLTAYLLSASVVTPIAGRLGDMFGKERTLVIALTVLGIGTLVAALARTSRSSSPAGSSRAPAAPSSRSPSGSSATSSPRAGGHRDRAHLGDPRRRRRPRDRARRADRRAFDYHWLFWFPLIVVVVATILAVPLRPRVAREGPRAGQLGRRRPALRVAGLRAARRQPGSRWGWATRACWSCSRSPPSCSRRGSASNRAPEPLVDMRMMRLRGVWTVNLAAFLIGAAMFVLRLDPAVRRGARAAGYGFAASVTQAGLFFAPVHGDDAAGQPARRPLAERVRLAGCPSSSVCAGVHGGASPSWPPPTTRAGRSTSPRPSSASASASFRLRWPTSSWRPSRRSRRASPPG